ncbi:hypothetical protein J27TS7_43640 [Paenibacillus dendritiformis]|nr:hypothetical protein J27TS7_43640 [Paenibacillus dendritiformis]
MNTKNMNTSRTIGRSKAASTVMLPPLSMDRLRDGIRPALPQNVGSLPDLVPGALPLLTGSLSDLDPGILAHLTGSLPQLIGEHGALDRVITSILNLTVP